MKKEVILAFLRGFLKVSVEGLSHLPLFLPRLRMLETSLSIFRNQIDEKQTFEKLSSCLLADEARALLKSIF